MQEEVNGHRSRGLGWEVWAGEGRPVTQVSPGWLPPLEEAPEEKDKGPDGTSVFATPVLRDAKGPRGSSAASEQYDPGGL